MSAAPPETADRPPAPSAELLARRRRVLGPAYRLFYDEPVHAVRARGVHLWDADGVQYLDAYNNVPSVGHGEPRVIRAVQRQLERLNTNTRYLQDGIVDYAEDLLSTFPDELGHVMFTCSGSEANDLALRVARHVTGHTGVVVTANAYHGVTGDLAAMSPSLGPGVHLGPQVRVVPGPDQWRSGLDDASFAAAMTAHVAAAVDDLERHGHGVAALVADGVFASDGIFPHPTGWLAAAAATVRGAGGLYVADEVQPGFGRLGEGMWGFARHGVVPDVVTLGKPMGNGMPIAAAVFRPELLEDFGHRVRYFNTYGGSSACVAAAQAVLDVVRDDDLVAHAHAVGARLLAGVRELTAGLDQVGQVRGAGLYLGVDLVTDRRSRQPDPGLAAEVVTAMRARHVLTSASGAGANVLKIRPPLVFTDLDSERLLAVLTEALQAALAR